MSDDNIIHFPKVKRPEGYEYIVLDDIEFEIEIDLKPYYINITYDIAEGYFLTDHNCEDDNELVEILMEIIQSYLS